MTALAADAWPHLGELAFERRQRARVAGMAADAAVRHEPVEASVVHLVARAEIPARRPIPGEGKLEEPPVLLGEVGARHGAASHHVIDALAQLVQPSSIGARQAFHLIEASLL